MRRACRPQATRCRRQNRAACESMGALSGERPGSRATWYRDLSGPGRRREQVWRALITPRDSPWFDGAPVALPLAIGRTAVADIERPPAADLVACAGRTIAGMRVIPPPGESRRRRGRVEDEERGGDGRNQNEIQSDHSGAPFYAAPPHSTRWHPRHVGDGSTR